MRSGLRSGGWLQRWTGSRGGFVEKRWTAVSMFLDGESSRFGAGRVKVFMNQNRSGRLLVIGQGGSQVEEEGG